MVQLNFNAAQVAPQGAFTVYETGEYTVMISGSELKPTKAKAAGQAQKGAYFQFNYRIAAGEHTGGTLIDRVNWENDNATAEEIGRAQLSAICRVTGVMHLQDTQQLHGIPFKVMVVKKPRTDDPTKFNNEITEYRNMAGQAADQIGAVAGGGGAPAAPSQPPAPPQQPPMQQAQPPVQQPWQQPAQQPMQQQAPAPTGAAPWQQEQAPAQQPVMQQPAQQPMQQPPAGAAPPWAQQPQQAPAGQAAPPWAQPQG